MKDNYKIMHCSEAFITHRKSIFEMLCSELKVRIYDRTKVLECRKMAIRTYCGARSHWIKELSTLYVSRFCYLILSRLMEGDKITLMGYINATLSPKSCICFAYLTTSFEGFTREI